MAKMPTKKQVCAYWQNGERWQEYGVDPDMMPECLNNIRRYQNVCFACSMQTAVQRCHIQARTTGGPDLVENIHLLCRFCHEESELLEGATYWLWIKGWLEIDNCWPANFARRGISWHKVLAMTEEEAVQVNIAIDELRAKDACSPSVLAARLSAVGVDVRL